MNADVFLDNNVLIYAALGDDPRKVVAGGLLAGGGTISVQVLNEFASVAHRKFRRSWVEITGVLALFRTLCPPPLPIGGDTHSSALTIAERDKVAFYDALIIASALQANCVELLTEDMQDGRVIDGRLTIRNPFAPAV